jgi:hypothetical protein
MTNDSDFGAGQARGSSLLARSTSGDSAANARVPRTPADFWTLAGQSRRRAAGSTPAAGGELSRLWVPTATRAAAVGRRNTPVGAREADITEIAALSFPEEFLPIVQGLALGKPDVTVSRLLDMSPRTFSRRVAEFLAYLEVETRFQAGVEVARRWMLPPNPRIH